MKQYVALARVSSREQEREGFSLDIQVDALKRSAESHDGTIHRLFRIAETASKSDERKTFRELIAYTQKHCIELDGPMKKLEAVSDQAEINRVWAAFAHRR